MVGFAIVPQASVKVTDTKSQGQGWVTSGTVKFTLQGLDVQEHSLSFNFTNAQSESMAFHQAASQLKDVADNFLMIAEKYSIR